jgi:hypothetical protein
VYLTARYVSNHLEAFAAGASENGYDAVLATIRRPVLAYQVDEALLKVQSAKIHSGPGSSCGPAVLFLACRPHSPTLPHPARRFASIRIIRGQVLYDFVSIHFH